MNSSKSLGARLRDARLEAGLSQDQVAAATGLSQGQISRIESGVRSGPRTRQAIAQTLGVELTAAELVA